MELCETREGALSESGRIDWGESWRVEAVARVQSCDLRRAEMPEGRAQARARCWTRERSMPRMEARVGGEERLRVGRTSA